MNNQRRAIEFINRIFLFFATQRMLLSWIPLFLCFILGYIAANLSLMDRSLQFILGFMHLSNPLSLIAACLVLIATFVLMALYLREIVLAERKRFSDGNSIIHEEEISAGRKSLVMDALPGIASSKMIN
jgi:hypothetical protein